MQKPDGVRLGDQGYDAIPTGQQPRMLRDNLLVKPLGVDDSAILEVVRHGNPLRGEVIAAGPGAYRREYSRDRKRTWLSETFVPTQVKPGDVVELGGAEIKGYLFPTIRYNGANHILCTERDVCGIVENS